MHSIYTLYAIYMYSVITVLYGDFLLTHTVHVHVTVIHEHVLQEFCCLYMHCTCMHKYTSMHACALCSCTCIGVCTCM